VINRDQAHDEALRLAREAEEEHLRIKRARRAAMRKLSELSFFCAANGISLEIVRAEAKGHGSNEREDKED
jgi:hypothetical protein